MTATCQRRCVAEEHMRILPKKAVECSFMVCPLGAVEEVLPGSEHRYADQR